MPKKTTRRRQRSHRRGNLIQKNVIFQKNDPPEATPTPKGEFIEYPMAYVDYPVAYFEYPVAYFDYPVAYFDYPVAYFAYIFLYIFLYIPI